MASDNWSREGHHLLQRSYDASWDSDCGIDEERTAQGTIEFFCTACCFSTSEKEYDNPASWLRHPALGLPGLLDSIGSIREINTPNC